MFTIQPHLRFVRVFGDPNGGLRLRLPSTVVIRCLTKEAGIILLLCALAIFSWLPRLKGPIDLRWDAGVYYILGTSLAEGRGYKLMNEPGGPDANQYPPLFPAIIAAHQWLLGTSDPVIVGSWLRLFLFTVFVLYVITIYLMIRSYLPSGYALLATLICLFNLHSFFLSDSCLPEVPFGLATVLFVLCNNHSDRKISRVLAGVLGIISYLLRSIGVALLMAWVTQSVFNRAFKRATTQLMIALIPVFFWQSYVISVESGNEYKHPAYQYQRADYLSYNVSYARNVFRLKHQREPELGAPTLADIIDRVLSNLAKIPTSLGEAVSVERKVWRWPFAGRFSQLTRWLVESSLLFLGCLVVVGIVLQLASRHWITPVYVLLSLGIICLTPWPDQFDRYLVPLAPFLALSLFITLQTINQQATKLLPMKCAAAGSVLSTSILLLIMMQQLHNLYGVYRYSHDEVVYTSQSGTTVRYRLYFYSPAQQALDEGLDRLRRWAKPGDTVVSSTPHWVYLRTGLKAVMPPFEANPDRAQHLVDCVPGNYLILNEGLDHFTVDAKKYVYPMVQNFADRWKRVYTDNMRRDSAGASLNRFEIYRRVDPLPPLSTCDS